MFPKTYEVYESGHRLVGILPTQEEADKYVEMLKDANGHDDFWSVEIATPGRVAQLVRADRS